MKRLLSLVVLGAVLIAACGGSSAVAATVDGQDVTVGEVEALMEDTGETVPVNTFAQFLSLQIQWMVVTAAAEEDFGFSATDEEVSAEADRLYEEFKLEDQSREDFLAAGGVSEDFLTNVARQELLTDQLNSHFGEDAAEPTDEDIAAKLNEVLAPLTNACVSHILVATEDEANDIFTRLDDGEDFGALAAELSTDTASAANNGDLGCGTIERYVPSFRDAVLDAPVGEVYDTPVESQYGWHVILVTQRDRVDETQLPDDEELAQMVLDDAAASEVNAWVLEKLAAADVTVTEDYGTWDAGQAAVIPPSS